MTISDAQFDAWLNQDDKNPVVLLEANYYTSEFPTTVYWSNAPWASMSGDSPANQPYLDVINSIPVIETRVDNSATLSEIELIKTEDMETYIGKNFAGGQFALYLGDASWPKSDFRQVFGGVCNGLYNEPNILRFTILDKRSLLNEQINVDYENNRLKPYLVGEVFNAEPVLVDSATYKYRCHINNLTLSDVRDNGVSVSYTDNNDGTFTLTSAPVGNVTFDGKTGDKNTGEIVDTLLSKAGFIPAERSSSYTNTSYSGIYVSNESSYLDNIKKIMAGVGGYLSFDKFGVANMIQLAIAATADYTIDSEMIFQDSIKETSIEHPRWKMSMGYKKNFAPKDRATYAASVSEVNRDLYSQEYSKVNYTTVPSGGYPLATRGHLIESYIVGQTDANTELTRVSVLRLYSRSVYEMMVKNISLQLDIGDTVEFDVPGHYLNGKKAQVLSKQERIGFGTAIIEVWL